MERKLLAALLFSRAAYNQIGGLMRDDAPLSDQGQIVFECIDEYYQRDGGAESVDKDLLVAALARRVPKHVDMFEKMVMDLQPPSIENVAAEYKALLKQRLSDELGGALIAHDYRKADELMARYKELDSEDDESGDGEVYRGVHLRELKQVFDPENCVPIAPKELNDKLGPGLPKGGHIFFYARPEAGKSLTGLNIARVLIAKGHTVLYYQNEDPAKLMLIRAIGGIVGQPRLRILADEDAAMEVAEQRGYNNLILASRAPGSLADVRKLVQEYEPDAVILDQLTNLQSRNQNKVERFEELAYGFRMMAKELNFAAISFAQAGESAEGKLMLDMDDVYFSNTGIPAQCDVMVGIGFNNEYQQLSRRYLSLPKNKIGGNHEGVVVTIQPEISRMVGV